MLARRRLMTGIAGLPLAVILADPRLAAMAAAGLETVRTKTAGGREVEAALAVPAKTPAPALLLIHEWWGLNDQIKSMASELAKEGYVALAVDLYGGKVATAPEDAKALMQQVDGATATDTLVSWIAWLRSHKAANGKVATIGWCFGGGWSLNASIATPVDATVIYYGNVTPPAEDLRKLNGPVLGQFGELDKFINRDMVSGFEANMRTAGKPLEVHWYSADHAFANPTGGRYDAEDASLAWSRTLEFLKANLG